MGLLCWLIGHSHDSDWLQQDNATIYGERDAVLYGKKIGTVRKGYKLLFCKRCNAVFHEKCVDENFNKNIKNRNLNVGGKE